MKAESFNTLRPRVLLAIGIVLIISDIVGQGILGLGIPWWIGIYLISASLYFSINLQKMVEKETEAIFVYLFFPGAFITALIPAYATLLYLALYTEL